MKKLTLIKSVVYLCILFIIVFFFSCSSCYYAPNAPNVPLFTEKNEASFSTSLHLGSISSGVDIQAAYAVTDHVGIMMNYNYYGGEDESVTFLGSQNKVKYRGNLIELGAGYFKSLEPTIIFETYAGIGYAGVENKVSYTSSGTTTDNTANYWRFFIQPAIGWVPNEHIALAFSTRINLLYYSSVKVRFGEKSDIYELMDLNNNPSFPIEPALTFRVGGKHVKVQTQLFYTFIPGNEMAEIDPFGYTLGLYFDIKGKNK